MVSPPKIKLTDEGELIVKLEGAWDCPWRQMTGRSRLFECFMPSGPAGKRGCPEYDCFPAGCPMTDGVTVRFKTKD
jgi:hypothetical protein